MNEINNGGLDFASVLEQIRLSFPIIDGLERYLKLQGSFKEVTVGWHCHLTSLTAMAAQAVIASGAKLILSECNQDTTNPLAVDYMRSLGAVVLLQPEGPSELLMQCPSVISDTGLVLISEFLRSPYTQLVGACEITSSGIARLHTLESLPLTVVNVNDCRLKSHIENFHGVGDGLLQVLARLSNKMWTGRTASVVGYGVVGSGAAHYLRKVGANVLIVEIDPVRRLMAHYDGFVLGDLAQALSCSELLVTATGQEGLIGKRDLMTARDGLLVVNLGHWPNEVDASSLEPSLRNSLACNMLKEFVIADVDGKVKSIFLATEGSPANVVLLTGSPEPTLIHLTTEILCLSYLLQSHRDGIYLPLGELPTPQCVERQASLLALEALGLNK